jgi:16S rRNA G966 N2-methylase RsmD
MLPSLSPLVFDFLEKHQNDAPEKVALMAPKFPDLPIQWISKQLKYRQKGKNKLPNWAQGQTLIFPTGLAYEQCSSQSTAMYKASLVSGDSLIDITGGTGVDSWALAQQFEAATYCERQVELCEIAIHNFSRIATNISVFHCNGITHLEELEQKTTCIYLDPHRRDEKQDRVFQLQDCEPDIVAHQDFLFSKSDTILLKSAPMADITACLRVLKHVAEVHIVSLKNECKELLFLLRKSANSPIKFAAVNLESIQAPFFWNETTEPTFKLGEIAAYLFEPNASILKGGAFAFLSGQYPISKLHSNSHLFTADKDIPDFPGRRFKVITTGNAKEVKTKMVAKQANISTRNYPMSAPQLAKKLKLKDGGSDYIFGTTNKQDKPILILCEKI